MSRQIQASSAYAGGAFSSRRVRRISGLLTLGLLVQAGVALDALAPVSAVAAPSPAPSTNEAPDRASALLSARLQGHRVEVTGARTPTVTLWANPEGTLTQEVSGGPIRMKAGDAWVPVDTTLVETPDGKVAPKAHPEGLVFSGGDASVKVGDALPGTAAPDSPTAAPSASPPAGAFAPAATATGSTPPTPQTSASSSPSAPAPTATGTPSPSAETGERAARGALRPALPAADPVPVPAEQELVKVGSGAQQIEMGWLGRLPKPVLSGSKATYLDARPGVDLVLEALRTGFEQYLVVKNRSAVSQAGTLTLPVDTTGYTVERKADGAIHLVDTSGSRPKVTIPAPVMWDASVDAGSGEHLHRAPVAMELRGTGADAELVFTPDAGFLADAKTVFPVTIDPAVNVQTSFDTFVQTDYASDQSAAGELKLGTHNNGGVVARSFLRFPEGDFHGKQILGASLNLYNFHSWSCTPAEWEVWDTDQVADQGTVWSNQPTWKGMWTRSSETQDTDGGDPQQCEGTGGWVKADVTNLVAAWSDNGNYDNTLGIRARYENNSSSWKRFSSSEGGAPPYLSVTYNSYPPTPQTDMTPSTPGGVRWSSSATPRFTSYAYDEDPGGQLWVDFELWTSEGRVGAFSRQVPNGTVVAVTPADFGIARLDEGRQYAFRSRIYDNVIHGGWSPDLTLRVDTVKPGAPFVTSAAYPADTAWHGKAGQPGTFTFTTPSGTTDDIAYVYSLDGAAPVTVNATGAATVEITPPADGFRVLKVQTKDRAGNLSDPTSYAFQVGQAGITSPVDGSRVAKRVKLSVAAQDQYKRVLYQYRRGPGAAEYDVPIANLTKANNTPITEAKPRLADLGEWANWTVVDTLGSVGGVVQVRAVLFPEDGSGTGYATGWNTMTVDRNADGAANTAIGPGAVNLLTGDYSTDATDTDEFGMSVKRASSSRDLARGWQAQGERLSANQHQVSTDLTGFVPGQANIARSTARGHDNSTDSLLVTPIGNDSYAALGPEYTLGQGMKPGKTYRLSGWIYVPAATGLNPDMANRGLRLVGFHRTPAGYGEIASTKAAFTDGWQQLTVDMEVPKDATEAWFRLYNGFAGGSGKEVFFDDLSLREIVAPFGPQWAGGPDAGGGSEYRSLSFPQSDLAEIKLNGDSVLTFARALDGSLWPEPGAEHLSLKATGDTYTLTDLDGSSTVFAKQSGSDVYQVLTETGPEAASQTRYVYDATDGRALPKRVVAPVEPGVDNANQCTVEPLPRGCEVLDYEYATATTAVPGTPGDFTDRVKAVKVWSWNPATSRQEAVEVTRYLYDERGRLAQVWDPRLAQPLKTTYSYDTTGRLTRIASAGELPWDLDYGPAGSDQDAGRLLKVRRATLTPGTKDQINGEIATKVVYDVPLTTGAGGPYDLSGAAVATWAQTDAPTDATAVYGPEDEPGTHTATAVKPGTGGYKQATVHYLNASGNEVNTATPSITDGGDIDTTEYDRYGHAVRTLEATNRSIALGKHPDSARFADELNLPAIAAGLTDEQKREVTASRARMLDSRTTYTSDGLDVKETIGPAYRALLTEAVAGQSTPVSQSWEAENLVQLGSTNPVRIDNNGCCGVTWSGAGQLGIRGTQAGHYATMRVSVPEEGQYVLSGRLTTASDHGIFQWSIDDNPVGTPIDGYAPNVGIQPYTTTPIMLSRGDHTLKLTFTGTNPSSGGERYHAGIDTVVLTKNKLNDPITAGTPVVARDHTTNTYDENKPDGAAYHLVTTTTDGARLDGYADDVEVRVTKTGYGTPIGGTSGWTLKKPTSVTTDALGAALTTSTRYDAGGRTEEVRQPGSNQPDARTVKSVYYTASTSGACGNRPEWAGQLCLTEPGADITGADAARMPTKLPVKQVTRYGRGGKAEEITETAAGKTRRTVTAFDAIGRTLSAETTGDEGRPVAKSEIEYDPATGAATRTTAAGKAVTTLKDLLGRVISYTDADGVTTTTEYDRYGKPVKVTDPTGVVTYTYDRAKEPRGMVTSVNDSRAGEFTATYGPDGQLAEQSYPGGIVRKDTANASGKAVTRTYTRTSDSKTIWAQNQEVSTQAQITRNTTTSGTKAYGYDRLGRLVKAEQTTGSAGCTTRTYAFDTRYNRTAKTVSGPATDGTCTTTTGGTTTTYTYDSADRLTDPGYTYDAFGRTVKTPAGTTIGYYTNDMVASQETAEARRTWTLDPTGRLSRFHLATSKTNDAWVDGPAKINHYAGDGDSPSWTVENESTNAWTRNTKGPDGDLAATSTNGGEIKLQLTDLFGSVVLITDTALTTPVLLDSDEYGNPATGQSATRYGWLGGKQRSTEALDGIVLMGVRLYNPVTGRFLSIDPIQGGSANAYEYTYADPLNKYDLDGRAVRELKLGGYFKRAAKWTIKKLTRYTPTHWGPFDRRNEHLVMRQGKPGVHWGNHQNRIEWDKRNGWHYNKAGTSEHFSVREGVRDLSRILIRRSVIAAFRAFGAILRSPIIILPGSWIPRPPETPLT